MCAEDFSASNEKLYQELYRKLLDHCPSIFNSMMEELLDVTLIM